MQKQIEKKEIIAALKHSQSVLEKKSSNQTYCWRRTWLLLIYYNRFQLLTQNLALKVITNIFSKSKKVSHLFIFELFVQYAVSFFAELCGQFSTQSAVNSISGHSATHLILTFRGNFLSYRVLINYCVFSLKFWNFSELCQFCCSADVLPAWCVYTHWHRGKMEKGLSPEYFKIFRKKHNI